MTAPASDAADTKTSPKAKDATHDAANDHKCADPAKLAECAIPKPGEKPTLASATTTPAATDASKPKRPGDTAAGPPAFKLDPPKETSLLMTSIYGTDAAKPGDLNFKPPATNFDPLTSPLLGNSSLLSSWNPSAKTPSYLSLDNPYDKTCKIGDGPKDLFDIHNPISYFGDFDKSTGPLTPMKPDATAPAESTWDKWAKWGAEKVAYVKETAVHTFDYVFSSPEDKAKAEKFGAKTNDAAMALLKDHKPGDNWKGEDGSTYKATPDGGLVHRMKNGDTEWYGKDGNSFTKIGKDETWVQNGETIRKHLNDDGTAKYTKTFGDGSELEITNGNEIRAIDHLEKVTVWKHHDRMKPESRAAFTDADAGINQHPDGQNYVKDDGKGNRFYKDEKHDYALVGTKDGKKIYAIQNGKVYEFDMEHHRFVRQELDDAHLPDSLKRNPDGSLQFGTININGKNEANDSGTGVKVGDRDPHIHVQSYGQDVDVHVENGKEITQTGTRVETYDALTDKLNVLEAGKPSMDYDWKTHILNAGDCHFSDDMTTIDGAFSLNELDGDIDFADGTKWSGSYDTSSSNEDYYPGYSSAQIAELHAAVAEASGLAAQLSTPGLQSSVLAQLYGILGKLDGISGGVEVQAAVGASKATVGGQINTAIAIGDINSKLLAGGLSNSQIGEVIAQRGPGVTDEFIVRRALHEAVAT